MTADHRSLLIDQDAVLLSITEGNVDHAALRRLPPWRAVMVARVAYKARAMNRRDLDALVREATLVGGAGTLKPRP